MIRVRGGSGLGDAIYVRAIVEELLRRGERVTVCTSYTDVFVGLDVQIDPFRRHLVDKVAHYTRGKQNPKTTQWQDVCASADIEAPLAVTWTLRNAALVEELRLMARGRPLVLVHGGRAPWGRTDGRAMSILPKKRGFDAALDGFRDCFTVQIGKDGIVYPLETSLDLTGRTSITDLFDLAQACDGMVGQCSYAIPLAEIFDKPALFVWAADGMRPGRDPFLQSITPQKVLSKSSSAFVVDEWPEDQIREEVRAFRLIQ